MASIMEAPAMLEDGNAPRNRRSMCLRVAFHALVFLFIISALVPITFCLLHHQQAPQGSCWAHGYVNGSHTSDKRQLRWAWEFNNCNGMLQDLGMYLQIQQSGNYFVYAQLYRDKTRRESIALKLYKDDDILNVAEGHENGTINFARPFFLQEGDKLYCKKNDKEDDDMDNTELRKLTYWGLIKM